MSAPRLRIELNKGRKGVEIDKLASVAKETAKFLSSLSLDLGEPESDWIAERFENGSVSFDVLARKDAASGDLWKRAFKAVLSNDFSDAELNVRIRPETRSRYSDISKAIPENDFISFGVFDNGEQSPVDWYRLDQ